MKMRRIFWMTSLSVILLLAAACSSNSVKERKYIGKFTDEFGNKFELREDHTATIAFVGAEDKINEVTWSDGEDHTLPYATISFNGNPTYYYMRDGVLYGSRENMIQGKCPISITWEDK